MTGTSQAAPACSQSNSIIIERWPRTPTTIGIQFSRKWSSNGADLDFGANIMGCICMRGSRKLSGRSCLAWCSSISSTHCALSPRRIASQMSRPRSVHSWWLYACSSHTSSALSGTTSLWIKRRKENTNSAVLQDRRLKGAIKIKSTTCWGTLSERLLFASNRSVNLATNIRLVSHCQTTMTSANLRHRLLASTREASLRTTIICITITRCSNTSLSSTTTLISGTIKWALVAATTAESNLSKTGSP